LMFGISKGKKTQQSKGKSKKRKNSDSEQQEYVRDETEQQGMAEVVTDMKGDTLTVLTDLKRQFEELFKSNDEDIAMKAAELTAELQRVENITNEQLQETQNNAGEVAEIKTKLDKLEEKRTELEKELNKTQAKAKKITVRCKAARGKIANNTKLIAQYEEKLVLKKEENIQLEEQIVNLKKEEEEVAGELEHLEQQLANTKTERSNFSDHEASVMEYEQSKKKIAEMQARIAHLKKWDVAVGSRNWKSWNVQHIANWVGSIYESKFSHYVEGLLENLPENEIQTGADLEFLEQNDLQCLGILSLWDRKEIFSMIQKLKKGELAKPPPKPPVEKRRGKKRAIDADATASEAKRGKQVNRRYYVGCKVIVNKFDKLVRATVIEIVAPNVYGIRYTKSGKAWKGMKGQEMNPDLEIGDRVRVISRDRCARVVEKLQDDNWGIKYEQTGKLWKPLHITDMEPPPPIPRAPMPTMRDRWRGDSPQGLQRPMPPHGRMNYRGPDSGARVPPTRRSESRLPMSRDNRFAARPGPRDVRSSYGQVPRSRTSAAAIRRWNETGNTVAGRWT